MSCSGWELKKKDNVILLYYNVSGGNSYKCRENVKSLLFRFFSTDQQLEGHLAIFQGKTTFDNPLATIRQRLGLAFIHFLANINVKAW